MSASEYADYLIAEELALDEFKAGFSGGWQSFERVLELLRHAARKAFQRRGYVVGDRFDREADEYLGWLVSQKAIRQVGDEYTGNYYNVSSNFDGVIEKYLANNSIAQRVKMLPREALCRALQKMAEEDDWDFSDQTVPPFDSNAVSMASVLPTGFRLSEAKRSELVRQLDVIEDGLSKHSIPQEAQADARAYIVAAKALSEAPNPPASLIWELIQRANAIAGIASLFVSIIAIFTAG